MKIKEIKLSISSIDPYDIADWAELYVAIKNRPLSRSDIIDYLQGSIGVDAEDSSDNDALINDVYKELSCRERLYGKNPPFKINENRIIKPSRRGINNYAYIMCLILSYYGNRNDVNNTAILFEKVSIMIISSYIGGRAIRFGAPGGMQLSEVVNQICEDYGRELPSNRQDRGVDIIAWKPFADKRSGQIVILAQCASGKNWKDKLRDVNLDAWKKHIFFSNPPIKAFVMPYVVSDDLYFKQHSEDCGILIDRPRIYNNSYKMRTYRKELKKWCKNNIIEF